MTEHKSASLQIVKGQYVNLACGAIYIPNWINLDYSASPPWVKQCNLLGRLPVRDQSCQLVYSSHFFEHIPISKTTSFLTEIYRILKPGGIVRIVTPDFNAMCEAYINALREGDAAKARFIKLEILDQCVRKKPGGELDKLYQTICQAGSCEEHESIKKLVYERTGEDFSCCVQGRASRWKQVKKKLASPKAALHQLVSHLRVTIACWIAPSAFAEQNISLTAIGENHAWLYTCNEVQDLLKEAGFREPERMTFATSNDPDFPCSRLDMNPDGKPRKGAGSMYIEAIKPI